MQDCILYGGLWPPPGGSLFGHFYLRCLRSFRKMQLFGKKHILSNLKRKIVCILYGGLWPPLGGSLFGQFYLHVLGLFTKTHICFLRAILANDFAITDAMRYCKNSCICVVAHVSHPMCSIWWCSKAKN